MDCSISITTFRQESALVAVMVRGWNEVWRSCTLRCLTYFLIHTKIKNRRVQADWWSRRAIMHSSKTTLLRFLSCWHDALTAHLKKLQAKPSSRRWCNWGKMQKGRVVVNWTKDQTPALTQFEHNDGLDFLCLLMKVWKWLSNMWRFLCFLID